MEVGPADALEERQGVAPDGVAGAEDQPGCRGGVPPRELLVKLPAAELGHPQIGDDEVELLPVRLGDFRWLTVGPPGQDDFAIEPEITGKICRRGLRIYELPIAYYGRTYDEGKKITWRDGFSALSTLVKYRFKD